ncbi:MAG TPA: hypothetical protein VKZ79_03750 [Alphaproteobacteria bacterium]|nr:hypothetical protein [Alphaproteobacteria bacterium]
MPFWGSLVAMLGGDPIWVTYGIVSVLIAYTMCIFGVVFGKMGRSPLWGLPFPLPFLGIAMLWTFGLGRWPQVEGDEAMESGL